MSSQEAPISFPALCRICGSQPLSEWLKLEEGITFFRCPACGVEEARYPGHASAEHEQDHFSGLDLERYERSVGATRRASYRQLLERVRRFRPDGAWLDVGCSFGWLLEAVAELGFDPHGIEPSESSASVARTKGLQVRTGFFPEDLEPGRLYGVVSFMDVLEHMEDPLVTLGQAREILTPDGLLVLQVPDLDCLLYRTASTMARVSPGLAGPLRRLWLTTLDFPHRFYFRLASLQGLLSRAGFHILDNYRSALGSPLQAFDRVGYTQEGSRSAQWILALGVAGIQVADNLWQHGGLLTVVARR